jgi:hypothetical protein
MVGRPGLVSLGELEATFSNNGKMPGSDVPYARWIGVRLPALVGPKPKPPATELAVVLVRLTSLPTALSPGIGP